jgi:hypothetical protein
VFKRVAEGDESDYVRDSVLGYLLKLAQHCETKIVDVNSAALI